ncbi:hypothetical protein EGW08_022422 [Elysia chlorotica]|uniref:Uncharacterized protein n=1 Tax=Elysia chlorotica TaxID=188477 RepID=A0A3S0ZKZ5_ELYCH|nr:hypothetical protein EGW08_022422 [Elysia chlorotica]
MVKNPNPGSEVEGESASDWAASNKSKKDSQPGKKKSKKKLVEDHSGKTEDSQGHEKVLVNERSKKVSFAEKDKKNLKDNTGKKDGRKLKECDEEEVEREDDFMINMSQKVSRAKQELELKKQAQSFACIQKRGGKTEGKRRQNNSRTRRGRKGTMGNTVPVSLDLSKKAGKSWRGRSARAGVSALSKPNGAMNLSESSSSEDTDESMTPSSSQCMKKGKVNFETRNKLDQESFKMSKTNAESSMVKPKSGTVNMKGDWRGVKGTSTYMPKPGASGKGCCTSAGTGTEQRTEPAGSRECPLRGDGAEALKQTRQTRSENCGQLQVEEEFIDKTSFLGKPKQKNVKTSTENSKSKLGGEVSDRQTGGSGDSVQVHPSAELDPDPEQVDMSKADVSVINRRHLASTLSYLNQRSREDRMLLHQMSGQRAGNAVELRMEQEDRMRRKQSEEGTRQAKADTLSNKEDALTEAMEELTPAQPGLSFEDALRGVDLCSGVVVRANKTRLNSSTERSKHTRAEPGHILAKRGPQDETSHPSLTEEKKIPTADGVRKVAVPIHKETPKTYSKLNENTVVNDSVTQNRTLSGKHGTDLCKGAQKRNCVTNVSISSTVLVETRDEFHPFSSAVRNDSALPVRQSDGDTLKSARKSKRSRAFDKPIKTVGSYDDEYAHSPQTSFQNQLKHLHESRSVKGHGPVYRSAPGPAPISSMDATARAFAGKGKGRGKNRTAEESASSGGFISTDERRQYENLTIDDLGSDFSDDGF